MTYDIYLQTNKVNFPAYLDLAENAEKLPAIILVHEVWGLNDHIKNVANRFAKHGFSVLAPDLLFGTGILEKFAEQNLIEDMRNPKMRAEAQIKMRLAMAPISTPEFAQDSIEKLQSCFKYLQKLNIAKIAILGFCFGGSYAWSFAASRPDLAAAVAFYGHAPTEEGDLEKIKCPVLAFYGEKDLNLMKDLPKLQTALKNLEKDVEFVVYPSTGHAFFNNTNPATYDQIAAEDAFSKTLNFLSQKL
jgi:carboxymethylenebutenolidase